MDKFTLEIELGNDDMQTPVDVSVALIVLAGRLAEENGKTWLRDEGYISDINGNSVGRWNAS